MSLKRNILANYTSQLYVTLIGIVMVPLFVRYMGAEAYGLVGFFAMLQASFQLLDMGLTPTMSRETARFRGGATDALSLRRLLRTLEGLFCGIAVLGGASLIAGAGFIADSWLNVEELPLDEVRNAVMLMALIVALRWVCGLYRGVITGFESIVWLSGFNIAIATARFVLVIPFFVYVGTSPTEFFGYQLVIAIVEIAVLLSKSYSLMPGADGRSRWQWESLRGVLKFSLSIAFTSGVWVFITQTDKLVLSTMLALKDYAYFTLAVLMASGVMVLSRPVSGALLPRLTRLNAEGDEEGSMRLYRNVTQVVCVATVPAALVLAFFPEEVLWVWTGDAEITRLAAPTLTLYALGNLFLSMAAFPYYLQFARGDLKLHLIGSALFVAIFIPLLIWAAGQYGMIGAGYAWITVNILQFVIWLPVVHRRFVKGLHAQWLIYDVARIVLPLTVAAFVLHQSIVWPTIRAEVALYVVMVCIALYLVAAMSSSWVRRLLASRWGVRIFTSGK